MKFNFFNLNKQKDSLSMDEELDEFGFKKSELCEYDKYAKFYHLNLINALILFTYTSDELDKMAPAGNF